MGCFQSKGNNAEGDVYLSFTLWYVILTYSLIKPYVPGGGYREERAPAAQPEVCTVTTHLAGTFIHPRDSFSNLETSHHLVKSVNMSTVYF